jgi:hypothetical protein
LFLFFFIKFLVFGFELKSCDLSEIYETRLWGKQWGAHCARGQNPCHCW